jgi:hypothetical protein
VVALGLLTFKAAHWVRSGSATHEPPLSLEAPLYREWPEIAISSVGGKHPGSTRPGRRIVPGLLQAGSDLGH